MASKSYLSSDCMEHGQVASILSTGYPSYIGENQDTPEARKDYIDDHRIELVRWLRAGHQEILDEFIEFSGQACSLSYQDWLN